MCCAGGIRLRRVGVTTKRGRATGLWSSRRWRRGRGSSGRAVDYDYSASNWLLLLSIWCVGGRAGARAGGDVGLSVGEEMGAQGGDV